MNIKYKESLNNILFIFVGVIIGLIGFIVSEDAKRKDNAQIITEQTVKDSLTNLCLESALDKDVEIVVTAVDFNGWHKLTLFDGGRNTFVEGVIQEQSVQIQLNTNYPIGTIFRIIKE